MKHKPFTRFLSLLLVVATLAGLFTLPASAASLNGSGTVNIQYLGRHEYLSKSTGGSLSGSSWSYTSNDGLTGTAYCVNWGLSAVSPNKALTLQEYNRNPQTMGVFANGYPMRTLEQFKELHPDDVRGIASLTEDEYKYATQVAVWASCGQLSVPGTSFTAGRAALVEPTSDAQKIRVYDSVKAMLKYSAHWTKNLYTGAFPVHGLEILAAAVICAVLSLALPPESHSPAAVSAFKKSRKDMRGSIALCPAAVCNLPLYLIEYVTGNDGFMGILNANPFRFRVPGQRFVFEGRHGQSVMDAVSDVVFIFQNLLDRRDIPRIAVFLRLTFIKPGVGTFSGVVEPAWGWYLFLDQKPCDFSRAHAMRGQIKYLLNNPLCFRIHQQVAFPVRVLFVTQRRVRPPMSAVHTANVQRGFNLLAGLPRVHFVEHVFLRKGPVKTKKINIHAGLRRLALKSSLRENRGNDKLNTLDSGECSSKLYSPFFHPCSRNKLNLERT